MWFHENNDTPWSNQGTAVNKDRSNREAVNTACNAFCDAKKEVDRLESLVDTIKNTHAFVGTRVPEAAANATINAIAAGQVGWAGSLLVNYLTPAKARELAKDASNRKAAEHVRERAQTTLSAMTVEIDEDFLTLINDDLVSVCLPAAIAAQASAKEAWEQELEKE